MWLDLAVDTFVMVSAVVVGVLAVAAAAFVGWLVVLGLARAYDWLYYRLPVRDR